MMAEIFCEQRAYQYAENCRGFLREELEQLSRKQMQEDATFQRLREHEIQRAREFEMRANAARNQEVSVSQERHVAQKEAFQLRNQQEATVAEARRVANELVAHQQRYDQMRENMTNEKHREAGVVAEQIEARWRQECQAQKTN